MKHLEKVLENISKMLSVVDKAIKEKMSPVLKGHESILLIVLLMMIVAGLSLKMVVIGGLTLAVLMSPRFAPGLIEKMSKKTEAKPVETKTEQPETDKKE